MDIVGYSDRFSVRPGQTIRFMVSCAEPAYRAAVVRLRHTDEFYQTTWSGKIHQARQIVRGEVPDYLVNKEVLERPGLKAKLERLVSEYDGDAAQIATQ